MDHTATTAIVPPGTETISETKTGTDIAEKTGIARNTDVRPATTMTTGAEIIVLETKSSPKSGQLSVEAAVEAVEAAVVEAALREPQKDAHQLQKVPFLFHKGGERHQVGTYTLQATSSILRCKQNRQVLIFSISSRFATEYERSL